MYPDKHNGAQILLVGTVLAISLLLAFSSTGINTQAVGSAIERSYLPLVVGNQAPTETPTPTSTNTPTPTETPIPTDTPEPGTTGNVVITDIFYDGAGRQESDEYVQIRNDDTAPIQLSGWTLRDEADHVFTFPGHVMEPGQVCRVYTNEYHAHWCGFSYGSGSAIWNNGGDCAELRDSRGDTVATYCY
jgi:hypothetical protein